MSNLSVFQPLVNPLWTIVIFFFIFYSELLRPVTMKLNITKKANRYVVTPDASHEAGQDGPLLDLPNSTQF